MNFTFGVFKGISAVVLLGLLLFFSASKFVESTRGFLLELAAPAARALWSFDRVFGYGLSDKEIAGIVKENSRLRALEAEFEVAKEESERLRAALGLSLEKIEFRGAHVLKYSHDLGKEILLIDRGTEHGLKSGGIVYTEEGILVGRVNEVSGEVSKVSSSANPGETQEVEILPSGTKALAKGVGAGTLELGLIPSEASIRIGDIVVLLGNEGSRVPVSLFVGHVASISEGGGSAFKAAKASLFNRPGVTREVFVLLSP